MTRANGARQQYVNGTVAQQYTPPTASAAAPAASPPPRDSREERDSNTNDATIAILGGLLGGASRQPAARPNTAARPNNPAPAATIAQAASPSYNQQPQRYSGQGDTRSDVRAGSSPSKSSSDDERDMTTQLNSTNCIRQGQRMDEFGHQRVTFTNSCGYLVHVNYCYNNSSSDMMDCKHGLGTWGHDLHSGETDNLIRVDRFNGVQYFACRKEFNGRIYTNYEMKTFPPRGKCVRY